MDKTKEPEKDGCSVPTIQSLSSLYVYACFVFNIPPTAGHMELKVSSNRLVKQGIEPTAPGLQGEWFIFYITAAPE